MALQCATTLVLGLALAACGTKGPLELPGAKPAPTSTPKPADASKPQTPDKNP